MGICGMSSLLYPFTEQHGVVYGRRTANIQYDYRWKVTTSYGNAIMGLALGYGLAAGFFKSYMANGVSTYEATLPVVAYKLFFVGYLPAFVIFAYVYPVVGISGGYCFSFGEAFIYSFGVAVPAYHMYSYGVVRTFDINLLREQSGYSLLE